MNQTVDTRTVEMRFDNKNFESNVKQSMSTLDKLKKSLKLKGASKGLNEIENSSKKLKFKDLNNNVDGIGKRFSVLETIATGALLRIGAKAADLGTKLVKSLSIDQIASGWNKYAEETTAVQTIMANLKEDTSKFVDEASKMEYVEGLLEKLMWFSDETSYNFTDMTGNVGKFIANGQDLDESVMAMQGIATWAAKSGQNAQTASRAMYNISQAMGVGAMTGIDWKSIEIANMATAEFKELAISVAVAKNKIKEGQVTVNNFRDSLAKKWFDKDVMMEVFKTYGGVAEIVHDYAVENDISSTEAIKNFKENAELAKKWGIEIDSIGFKAFMAAQEAKTFGEVIAATADAASTKWSRFFKNIFGNYLEAKKLWTDLSEDLWNIFAAPIDELNEIMGIWKKGFFVDGPVSDLQKAFRSGILDDLESAYHYVTKEAAAQAASLDSSVYSIEEIEGGVKRIIKTIKREDGTIEKWYKEIYDPKELLSGRDLLIGGFKNLMETIFTGYKDKAGNEVLSILQSVKAAFDEIFFLDNKNTTIAKKIWDLTKRFNDFTERIKPTQETIEKIKNAFKGLFSVFKIGTKFVKAVFKPFKDILKGLFGLRISEGIVNLTDKIGKWLQKLDEYLTKGKKFESVSTKIKNGINMISKSLTGLSLSDLIKKVRTDVTNFFQDFDFKKTFKPIIDLLHRIDFAGIFRTIVGIFGGIVNFFRGIFSNISNIDTSALPDKLKPIQEFWVTITDFVKSINVTEIFNKVIGAFITAINFIKQLITEIKQVNAGEISDKLTPIQNFWLGLKSLFDSVKPIIPIIVNAFGNILRFISDSISKLSNTENLKGSLAPLQNYWEGIKELAKGAKSILVILSGPFRKVATFIGEFLASIANNITASHKITRSLNRSRKRSAQAFNGIKEFFQGVVMFFSAVGGMLAKIAGFTGKALAGLAQLIRTWVENTDASEIVNKLLKAGIIIAILILSAQIKYTSGIIKDLIKSVSWLAEEVRLTMKAKRFRNVLLGLSAFILSIAALLVVMTSAVKNLGIGQFLAISGVLLAFIAVPIILMGILNKMAKSSKKVTLFDSVFPRFQSLMLSIAAFLVIMSVAFKIFAGIDFGNVDVGQIAFIFASAVGITILTAWAVKTFMKSGTSKAIASLSVFSGFMISIAAAMVIFAYAFKIIANCGIDPGTLALTAFIFAGLIAVVGIMALVAKEFLTKKGNMAASVGALAAMSGFMIAVAAAMVIFAHAFKIITSVSASPSKFEMSKKAFLEMFVVFSLISTGMAALGSLLIKNAMAIAGVAVMAGFMVTAAISLSIVALAFSKISDDISPAQMGLALAIMITFGAIVGVLAAIGSVLAGTGVGAAGMALVAAIITAIGFACLGAGVGIAMFINAISKLIDTFMSLMKAVSKYGQQFIDSIGKIIDSALDGIINSQEKLKNALISVFTSIAEAIIVAAPIISKALIVLLITIMENVKETINVSTKLLAETLVQSVIVLIDSIAEALRAGGPYLAKAFRSLLESLIEIAMLTAAAIVEPFGKVGKGIAEKIVGSIPEIRKKFELIDEEGDSVLDNFIEEEKKTAKETKNTESALESLLKLFTGSSSIDFDTLLGGGFGSFLGNYNKKTAETTEAVKNETEAVQNALQSAYEKGHLDDIESGYGYVSRAAAEAAASADSATYSIGKLADGTEVLFKNVKKSDGSIERLFKKFYDSEETENGMSDFVTSIKGTVGDLQNSMYSSGVDSGNNFISGVRSTFEEQKQTANAWAYIYKAIMGFSEPEEGPLSKFHTFAPDMIKLWCKGVHDNLGKVDKSSNSMASRINEGFGTALDYVSSLIDDGMSDDLTIRPIMDLSEIQNGADKLDSIIRDRNGYSLSGTVNATSSAAYGMKTFGINKSESISQPAEAGNSTFNNTFNITSNDPNAVAKAVSRIIQKQVVRKQAVWAK